VRVAQAYDRRRKHAQQVLLIGGVIDDYAQRDQVGKFLIALHDRAWLDHGHPKLAQRHCVYHCCIVASREHSNRLGSRAATHKGGDAIRDPSDLLTLVCKALDRH